MDASASELVSDDEEEEDTERKNSARKQSDVTYSGKRALLIQWPLTSFMTWIYHMGTKTKANGRRRVGMEWKQF